MIVFEKPEFKNESAVEKTDLIEKLLDIGAALSSAQDLGELLNLILSKSREITYSDAGSVYLVDHRHETPKLVFKVAQNGSKPRLSFKEFSLPLTDKSLAGYVAITGQSLNLSDAYDLPSGVPYQLDTSFDRDINYRTCSGMGLPMQNRQGETIGVLQLINRTTKAATAPPADHAGRSPHTTPRGRDDRRAATDPPQNKGRYGADSRQCLGIDAAVFGLGRKDCSIARFSSSNLDRAQSTPRKHRTFVRGLRPSLEIGR